MAVLVPAFSILAAALSACSRMCKDSYAKYNKICFLFSVLAGRGRELLHHLWSFFPHPFHFTRFYQTADEGGVGRGRKKPELSPAAKDLPTTQFSPPESTDQTGRRGCSGRRGAMTTCSNSGLQISCGLHKHFSWPRPPSWLGQLWEWKQKRETKHNDNLTSSADRHHTAVHKELFAHLCH